MKNIRQEKLLQIISEEAIETQEQLLQRLRQAVSARPQLNVLIISDGSRQYEEVIEIHRYAYHAGAKNIYLVTQAERH